MTPNIALRLARCLGTSPEVWPGLQNEWDLYHACRTNEYDTERETFKIVIHNYLWDNVTE